MKNGFGKSNYIFVYPAALFFAWFGAWLINGQLRARFHWTLEADTCFWILMKIVIWVLPALIIIYFVERASLSQFLQLRNVKKGLLWGGLAGIVVTAITFAAVTLPSGGHFHVPTFSLVLLNAVVIAPLVEEIALRGFFLRRLQLNGVSFWIANVMTSLTFVLMHLPGWYFQGKTFSLASSTRSLLSLATLGLLFGWTKYRSGSLYAALLPHTLNNLYSSLFA